MSDHTLQVTHREILTDLDTTRSGLYRPAEGVDFLGIEVTKIEEDKLTFTVEGKEEYTIETGKWFRFDRIRNISYEIYGDEYESTVGDVYDVCLDVYHSGVMFDQIRLSGIDKDLSILVSRTDGEGNPKDKMAVILFADSEHQPVRRLIKATKRIFLREYRKWMDGEEGALGFLGENEANGRGYEQAEGPDAYILRKMYHHAFFRACDEALEGEDDNSIDRTAEEFRSIGIFYAGPYRYHMYDAVGPSGRGECYYFADHDESVLDEYCSGVAVGSVYNTDAKHNRYYTMNLIHMADKDESEIRVIHRELVRLILAGEDIQDYLDSLGFPIVVQYDSNHYRKLGAALSKIEERKRIRLKMYYDETGHDRYGETVDKHLRADREVGVGYINLYDVMDTSDWYVYPEHNDYVKVEQISDYGILIRLPSFVDGFSNYARGTESGDCHFIPFDCPKEFTAEHTVTCHKYTWKRRLKVECYRI